MATYKFYAIKDANAEIERLGQEVARLTAEAGKVSENSAIVDGLKADLAARDGEITTLKNELTEKVSALAAAVKSNEEAAAETNRLAGLIESPDSEIERRASMKALEIAAGQGAAVVPVKANTETASQPNTPQTWTEKVKAAKSKES
jgi:hypothetical protein